jgi:Cof subfamily protein (haloacid dehalogenase superfamily)
MSMPLRVPVPKVVATDLDGTIVRTDGTISARTLDALQAAEDAGALVIVVTGRPPRWLKGIADATGAHGLAICANGALVYDLTASEVVASRPMASELVADLMSRLRNAVDDINFAVECINGEFIHEPTYIPRWTPEPDTVVGEILPSLKVPVAKLLARREQMSSDTLLGLARAAITDHIATLTHSSIDGLLEINGPGVTKASTLEWFLADHGLAAADVIAFGDMPNDVEMLAWAGHGVAVANAHPEVMAVVDEVTLSNDEDGVAVVLERVFGS